MSETYVPFHKWLDNKIRDSEYRGQDEFAEAIGVSQSAVSHWIGGISVPTTTSMTKIREALGLSEEEVWEAIRNARKRRSLPRKSKTLIGEVDWTSGRVAELDAMLERFSA